MESASPQAGQHQLLSAGGLQRWTQKPDEQEKIKPSQAPTLSKSSAQNEWRLQKTIKKEQAPNLAAKYNQQQIQSAILGLSNLTQIYEAWLPASSHVAGT